MRYACTVLIVLGLAASASAQRRGHPGGGNQGGNQGAPPQAAPQQMPWWSSWNSIGNPPPPVGTPLPPIGTPQNALAPTQPTIGSLPSIGLGLPSIGLGLPAIGLPPHAAQLPTRPFRGGGHRGAGGFYPYGYPAVAYAGYGSVAPGMIETPQPAPPPEPVPVAGGLRLEVEPADQVQVFVDGTFIGPMSEIGNEFSLEPGVRRIELRAEGYKTVVFSAQIFEGRIITYRATLERDPMVRKPEPVQLPPVVPSGSRTLYVIPGCYLGNVSPQEVKLPAGCDIGKLRTIQ